MAICGCLDELVALLPTISGKAFAGPGSPGWMRAHP
jgi:hypothetical protein